MAAAMYKQVSQERYDIIIGRYKKYLDNLNVVDSDPVRVFDPLSKKAMDDLALIREVSRELQLKKDEDVKKAAQNASQAEEEAKKVDEKPDTGDAEKTEEQK